MANGHVLTHHAFAVVHVQNLAHSDLLSLMRSQSTAAAAPSTNFADLARCNSTPEVPFALLRGSNPPMSFPSAAAAAMAAAAANAAAASGMWPF